MIDANRELERKLASLNLQDDISSPLDVLVSRLKNKISDLESSLILAGECKEKQTNEINKLALQLEYSRAQHDDEIRSLRESRDHLLSLVKQKVSDETINIQAALTESRSSNSSLLTSLEGLERRLYSVGDESRRNQQLLDAKEKMNEDLMHRLSESNRVFTERISTLAGLVRDQALEIESLRQERTRMELRLGDLQNEGNHLRSAAEQSKVSAGHMSDLQAELDSRAREIDNLTAENRRLRFMGMHFLHRHIDAVS